MSEKSSQPHFNKLYNAYTFGVYQKTYINKYSGLFLETDIFYRNWSFKKKPAEFRNVEGYNFKGVRTENVNVYALKVLFGKTFLSGKERKFRTYWDVYAGAAFVTGKKVLKLSMDMYMMCTTLIRKTSSISQDLRRN